NKMDQTALPIRNWGAFMPPNGIGGGGVHWNAETWRFLPSDFVLRTHLTQRYGASFLPEDMTIQDYGVTYDELEPHYDAFEYLCGTGRAGRQSARPDPGGRQSVRGSALATVPQSAAEAGLRARALGKSSERARLQTIPATVREHVAALRQSARRSHGAVHLLRLLRVVRLRELFQVKPANDPITGARAQGKLQRARQLRGDQDQSRRLAKTRHRRDLRRLVRRGMGAARRSRDLVGLRALQRAATAAVENRQANYTHQAVSGVDG